uniref:Probable G-protein coupled receptor 34 n=1 Tax=Varanus komodoensis TaxID=61221 RepID=A0A8D2Q5S4_VARKO
MNTSLHTTEFPTTGARGLICEIQNGFLEEALPPMYSIISIIGFFSNALALWVFHFGTQRLNSITVYMKSLAISDLLLAFCLLFRAAYQNQSGPQIICKLVGIIFYLTMYVSIFLLSLICLDRYLKIIRPLQQFRIHTVPNSTAAVWAVWLICAGSMLLFFAEDDTKKPCSHRCFHFKKRNALGAGLNMAAVATFFFLLGFFLYSYSKIAFKLRMVSLKKTHQGSKTTNSKAIMKTFVVLATFLICFAPYHVVRVPYILAQVEVISSPCVKQALHVANELVLCISALNCCFDPVIFYFLSSSFKRALLAAIHGKLRKSSAAVQ